MNRKSTLNGLIILVSMGILGLAGCGKDNLMGPDKLGESKFTASESFSYEMEIANHQGLKLEAINGSITISQNSQTNKVRITGEKLVKSESKTDAEERLDDIKVFLQNFNNDVSVKTKQPKHTQGRDYSVNYTISLPQNMNMTVICVNGKTTLNDIVGSVFVKQSNGEINGNVILPLDGTIDMSVSNGKVKLEIPKSTSAKYSSSVMNGSISLSNLTLQNKVETSNSVQGTLGSGKGTISLNTTNGDIQLTGK